MVILGDSTFYIFKGDFTLDGFVGIICAEVNISPCNSWTWIPC